MGNQARKGYRRRQQDRQREKKKRQLQTKADRRKEKYMVKDNGYKNETTQLAEEVQILEKELERKREAWYAEKRITKAQQTQLRSIQLGIAKMKKQAYVQGFLLGATLATALVWVLLK